PGAASTPSSSPAGPLRQEAKFSASGSTCRAGLARPADGVGGADHASVAAVLALISRLPRVPRGARVGFARFHLHRLGWGLGPTFDPPPGRWAPPQPLP